MSRLILMNSIAFRILCGSTSGFAVMVDRVVRFLWHRLLFVLLTLFISGFGTNIDGSTQSIPVSSTGSSHGNSLSSSTPSMSSPSTQTRNLVKEENPHEFCPSNLECSKLGGRCVDWNNKNNSCVYGKTYNATCTAKVNCTGEKTFPCLYHCRYCYQLEAWQYTCNASTCPINTPRKTWPARPFYFALCSPRDDILCLGNRDFYRRKDCNWTSGYKWSTALILSITLGGFGADRFYLGLWKEGIGKLFSFGGLGVWTLVDVILIAVGYVGPADGSVYI